LAWFIGWRRCVHWRLAGQTRRQNPVEAAKLRTAILHGPHVWNFADIYAALDNAHGAGAIDDVDRLTALLPPG
jgi:3-deoxy-D-manno-octulosonic-acid transferase